jgi:hypothetical protein
MARQAGGAVLQAVRAAAVATSPTDRVLLAKFIEGDEAAFAALVTRHTGMVLGVFRLVGHWWDNEATRTAEFTAWFNPHERYEIVFQHPEKGLVGVTQPPQENGGPATVRLEPGATVTGRLVDAGGKPRAGVELELRFRPKRWGSWFDYTPGPIKTDREGRFRIEAMLPGQEYRLSEGTGELPLGGGLRWGETKDLGDVTAQPLPKE